MKKGIGVPIGKKSHIKYLVLKAQYKNSFSKYEFDNSTQLTIEISTKPK